MKSKQKEQTVWASVLAIVSVFYTISPFDIIPDIPVVGWIDDFFIVSAASLNLMEKITGKEHQSLRSVLKALKWVMIVLGVVVILLLLLLGTLIYNLIA
jgi:uncharacterized membrane protein YkvA (DUF1232 family)